MPRVVIIGAGISGLALAYRLEQRQPTLDVQVLEQQTRLGGTIHTLYRDGFQVEAGPNGFLDNKPSTRQLCEDLGIGELLLPARETAQRNRYLFFAGRLHRLPSSLLTFLTSPLLSFRGKLALIAERFRRSRPSRADESIAEFARRRVGREVTDTLVDAFVTGIHAGDPELLSIEAAFPRLAQLEREHGSVLRGLARQRRQRRAEAAARGQPAPAAPRMWSFSVGMGQLIETLAGRLRQPPLLGVAVRRVQRFSEQGIWRIEADGRASWDADVVVLTCPAPAQAALLQDADSELASRLAEIPYNRIAVVALGYRAEEVPTSLDGFGYLCPQRERRDVLGVQWCSSIFPGRAPESMVLLRAMCGGWGRPEMIDWDDDRLVAAVRADLAQALHIQAPPRFVHLTRWPRAIPQYHVGHRERLTWMEARLKRHPGLYLGGNAHRGIALNDCVEQAGLLAEQISQQIAR
jgi:oxygen-dependent protoporphyrinogen oxidase